MRPAARALAVATLLAIAASLLAATSVAQTPQDSVLERLRRAEEALEQLRAQGGQQDRPTPHPPSRRTVEVSGQILVNAFYNTGKTNNSDVPGYADSLTPADASGLPLHNLGAAVRQTRLTLTVSGLRTRGASITGTLQADFFGGQQPSSGGRTYPLLRMRVASVRADWAHVSVLVGQDALVIAPVNPVSYASFAAPLFLYSGNLWFRAPQVRVTAETFWHARLGVQAAALAPMQPTPQGALLTQPDSAERSGLPSLEGRLYVKWGRGETASEVGLGGHLGWLATSGDSLLRSQAVAADARIAIGPHVVIAGEAFSGEALGAMGGAVGQNLGWGHVPVGSRGGWLQADVRPVPAWEFGGGFGIDNPVNADVATGGRERNVTYAGHLIYRSSGGVLLGAEFRRIETSYATRELGVSHFNAYAGLFF